MSENLEEMASHEKGAVGEAYVKAELMERGYRVLSPEFEHSPYDLAIEKDGEFYRIQIKTIIDPNEETIKFRTSSINPNSDGLVYNSYEGRVDYFAVYSPNISNIYVVPIEDTSDENRSFTIRYQEPEIDVWDKINWHKDYLIENQL